MKIVCSGNRWNLLAIVGALVIALSGCYPGGVETLSELDTVFTNYDEDYFAANNPQTYYMPDTVVVLFDPNNSDPGDIDFPPATERLILDRIEDNLASLGYTRLDVIQENSIPDVVVLAEVARNRYTGGGCYYPWWPGWGGGGWWPGWGWGPGWGYPCYPQYYSYETGTVAIQMIDPEESDEAAQILGVVWRASLNGVVRSSNSTNNQLIANGIDQAFNQSEDYLQRGR